MNKFYVFLLFLILNLQFVSEKSDAGLIQSKEKTVKQLLKEMFSKENVKVIRKQHPGLTPEMVREIFRLIKAENKESSQLNEEELMSKFTIFASQLVGFK